MIPIIIIVFVFVGGAILPSNEAGRDESWWQDRGGGKQGLTVGQILVRSMDLRSTVYTSNGIILGILPGMQGSQTQIFKKQFNLIEFVLEIILLFICNYCMNN